MFTGIISHMGQISARDDIDGGAMFWIGVPVGFLSDVVLGDSIAVNGACLTVAKLDGACYRVEVSHETMAKTTASTWQIGSRVNLEKAMRLSDRLGGHLVAGHVDGVGVVADLVRLDSGWQVAVTLSQDLMRYTAPKGSITLDGVSLTTNAVDMARSQVHLTIIEHTRTHTTIKYWQVGRRVNVEVDLLARYMAQLMDTRAWLEIKE